MIALAQDPTNRSQATANLAEKLQIPLPFLHQIGRSLIQGRLLRATPGPHGGLRLNLPAEEITLLQVIETLEGPVCLSPLDTDGESVPESTMTSPVWNELQGQLTHHLASVRLSTLASAPVALSELVHFEADKTRNN